MRKPAEPSAAPGTTFFDTVRRTANRWRTSVIAATSVLFGAVGSRIGIPGVDGQIVRDFFHGNSGGILGLYNLLVGGAVSRAAVLALGIMPYLSAKCFVWIARSTIPAFRDATADDLGQRKLTRWTRVLSVGLALVQSAGFARFVQSIPGAVAHPGAAFIARTMLVLTGGAIVVTWLGEQITTPRNDPSPAGEAENEVSGTTARDDASPVVTLSQSAPDPALLGPGEYQTIQTKQPQWSEVDARPRRAD